MSHVQQESMKRLIRLLGRARLAPVPVQDDLREERVNFYYVIYSRLFYLGHLYLKNNLKFPLYQGAPTPVPGIGTGPQPVKNRATQQEVSSERGKLHVPLPITRITS